MLCETMASAEEARAAAIAAAESGKPVWVSWTLADDPGPPRLRSGETLATAAQALEGIPLAARLVNCSRPEAVDAALPDLVALGGPVGAYANAFTAVEALKHGGTVDVLAAREDLGPERYADFALRWAESGAAIVGGCCETGPGTSLRCATGSTEPASRRPRPDLPLPSAHARRAADRPPAGRSAR